MIVFVTIGMVGLLAATVHYLRADLAAFRAVQVEERRAALVLAPTGPEATAPLAADRARDSTTVAA